MVKKRVKAHSDFLIHGCMTQVFGLRGSELLVFAFLFSFTTGKGGLYWGSQSHLAASCGVSTSTASRALSSLKEKGLIEKCTVDNKEGYRCR
ncbi:MAG: helix-turn-helix domain-containing protein [Clostridia bacterium]|nr:helix-turn-helix domain-containing protein [Clostridia bacterium]